MNTFVTIQQWLSNDNTKNAYALNDMDQFNHKVTQGTSEDKETKQNMFFDKL